jgi:RHS repeat-associated protein
VGTDPKDLFAFKINYNMPTTASTTALYNGNIAETYWKTANDDLNRGYAYQYDNLNRLKAATYQKAGTATNAYNESLTYDKNGNILSLNRNGTSETATAIDKLAYTYSNNQLLKVADTSNKTQGFVDGTNTDNDFTYDVNGNMTIDKNKGITAIAYNHLNLPIKITFGTTGNIVYVYNATGQKLKKVVTQGTTVTTTDYLGGYQYVNNTLQFFPTAEGYVSLSGTTYSYTYQYKDHLGNVRLSYTAPPSGVGGLVIVEESHYYPFGLKQTGYNNVTNSLGNSSAQKIKYNGKELQDELGLNMYDYGARNYDATIGRWMNIDPLAELGRRWSPYNYAVDNPVYFIDPDGMAQSPFDDSRRRGGKDGEDQRKIDVEGNFYYDKDNKEKNFKEFDDPNNPPSDNYINTRGFTPHYIAGDGDVLDKKKKGKGGKGGKGNGGKPSYTPPPKDLPDDAERLKPKGGRPRYRLPDGDIIEWDGQHGEWERYNPRGKHTGVLSPDGELIKDPVPGRRIEPIVQTTVNTAATVTAGYIIYKTIVAAATWECLGCGVLVTP